MTPTPDEHIHNVAPPRLFAGRTIPNGRIHLYRAHTIPGHPDGPVPLRALCGNRRRRGTLPLTPARLPLAPASVWRDNRGCARCWDSWSASQAREAVSDV